MWRQIRTALALYIMMILLTGVVYPLLTTGLAKMLFPEQANGSIVMKGERKIASKLIGQQFRSPGYFWGRPSATSPAGYNSASSTGSNLGPSNPDLKAAINMRVAALHTADPENRMPIPIDLVTASGSGLDPHISPASALYQVSRVSKARGLDEKKVAALVTAHINNRQWEVFGEPTVNVLQLNMALDALR
jgi:potassium-transporting ATPase KdpC subunit